VIQTLTIFESGQFTFLKKLMLYFSISVLVNTSFFPTVQRYILSSDELHWQIDSSLIELVAGNILGITDAETDLPDEGDDVNSSIDFISLRTCWNPDNSFILRNNKVPANNSIPDDPTLEKFTPPPQS